MAVRSAWSRAARAAGRRLGPHAAVDILQSGHRLGVNVVHSNTIKAAVGTMLSDVTPVAAERLGQLVHGAGSEHPTSLTVALVALYGRMGDHRKAFAAFRDGPWRGATPGTWSPHLCRALLEAFGRRTMVDDEQTYGQEHLSEVAFRLAEFVFQQYLRGVSSITPGDSRQDIWHLVALQMSVCGRTAINPLPRASRLLQQAKDLHFTQAEGKDAASITPSVYIAYIRACLSAHSPNGLQRQHCRPADDALAEMLVVCCKMDSAMLTRLWNGHVSEYIQNDTQQAASLVKTMVMLGIPVAQFELECLLERCLHLYCAAVSVGSTRYIVSVCDAVALVALESFSMDATLGPIPFQVLRGDVTHLSSHAATAVVEDHVLVPPCVFGTVSSNFSLGSNVEVHVVPVCIANTSRMVAVRVKVIGLCSSKSSLQSSPCSISTVTKPVQAYADNSYLVECHKMNALAVLDTFLAHNYRMSDNTAWNVLHRLNSISTDMFDEEVEVRCRPETSSEAIFRAINLCTTSRPTPM